MLSGNLWPAHPHPYSGECLSSWIVRLAHANGLKVQTFCDHVFGKQFQIWNRDIDRNTPEWLVEILSRNTGTTKKEINKTTFKLYEKRLFPYLYLTGHLRWVISVKHFHRIPKGYAFQYCPLCLKGDKEPYFRLAWRLAFYTFCPKHEIMMHDRCFSCGAQIAFHRIEQGKPNTFSVEGLSHCWMCDTPLENAPSIPVSVKPKASYQMWKRFSGAAERGFENSGPLNYRRISLLHQVCLLLTSRRLAPQLQQYICTRAPFIYTQIPKGNFYEEFNVLQRHYITQLAWWLNNCIPRKIVVATRLRAVKLNELYKDAPDLKPWITRLTKSKKYSINLATNPGTFNLTSTK